MAVFQITLSIQDAYARRTVKRFECDVADFATAGGVATSLATDFAALSEAEVLKYSVGQETTWSDSVTAGANLDEGITLSVQKEDGSKAVIKVPAPINSVINPDGTVDITATAVTDYVDNWISNGVTISDGEVVTSLLSGKLDR